MTSFRTEIVCSPDGLLLHHQKPLLAMGSCFARHIGRKLAERKFSVVNNPFGILYNPISLTKSLNHILDGHVYQTADLFSFQELWHSFDHHGQFSHPDSTYALKQINESLAQAKEQLGASSILLLTLGTAQVFEHRKNGKIVANCHKLPPQDFKRYRLSLDQVVTPLAQVFERLAHLAPGIRCLLTVSPVRHLKDGLIANQRSKATLLLAAEQLCQQFDWVHYFPAYEIVLDDLRDYRFYEADLSHPNPQAIDYVWSKFSNNYFSEDTLTLNRSIEKILQASQHRPFHPASARHQSFLQKQLEKIARMEEQYPFLDFGLEKEKFGAR